MKDRDDPVNHPSHYTAHPSGVECIEITRHMNFNCGNAVKYIWRADLKGSSLEDLKKAAFYIADEIARREKESDSKMQTVEEFLSEVGGAGSSAREETPQEFFNRVGDGALARQEEFVKPDSSVGYRRIPDEVDPFSDLKNAVKKEIQKSLAEAKKDLFEYTKKGSTAPIKTLLPGCKIR